MPLYEYWCHDCRKRITLYVRGYSSASIPVCPQCSNNNIRRLFSTFSVRKTDKDIYEDILTDSQLVDGMMRNDPRAMADWNNRMSRGIDQEATPEYDEMLHRMESGEWPTDLIKKSRDDFMGESE